MREWRLTLLLLALCGPARASELEPVTLQLKWKHQFQFAGYYVAAQKGYYRQAGLDVRFVEAQPGREPIDAVLSGEAEYGVGTSDLLLYRARGVPVVVLGVLFQHSPLELVALKDSGVTSVHDLVDRRVMIEPHSAELLAFLTREGVPPARLRQQPHSFDVNDLLSGAVDAMSVYSTDEPWALQRAGRPYVAFTPREAGVDFYGDNLFTTEAEVSAHPDRVKAFRDASFRGWKDAMEHPADAVDLILAKYPTTKSRDQLLFEAEQMRSLVQPELLEPGYMHAGRWQHMASVYLELGMLQREVPMTGFLYATRPAVPSWVGWAFAALVALTALGGGAAGLVFRANRSLAREIASRAESEQRFRALFESAPEPTWLLVDGRIAECSASAASALGAPGREALEGRTVLELTAPEPPPGDGAPAGEAQPGPAAGSAEAWQAQVDLALREGRARFPWRLARAGAGPMPVVMTLARLRWRGQDAVFCSFRDVSAHLETEAALERARAEAEAANNLKSLFLANMTHELRTPLHAITSLAWLGQRERNPGQLREYFDQIHESSETLARIVNDVLDFSRIEAGRLQVESVPFELRKPLGEVRTLFAGAAQRKRLAFSFDVDPELPEWVQGDPLRVKQVLTNLCSNAIKFTERGQVAVRALLLSRAPERVSVGFDVDDSGVGMSAEQVAKLFQPFTQADASITRRYGGTGLGLAISRQLVGLMGGILEVESAPGRGSTFSVALEFELASAPGATAASPRTDPARLPPDLHGLRVLVVEDNPVNQVLAARLLDRVRATVTVVGSGRGAVDALAANPAGFDAVLMDLQMPELDGYQATEAIRGRLGVKDLPIYAMSAHALAEDKARCLAVGMNGHLAKPIDVGELYATLAALRKA